MENNIQLFLGDNRNVLKNIAENSVDSVACDPPYELGFMGKKWDSTGIANDVNLWKEVLRVLKPGGHLLAFSGSRTYHRMVCAIEDAGFEIRDQIMWVYGSGFPKSLNIGKAVDKLLGNERDVVGIGKSGNPETHTASLNMSQVNNNTFGGEFEVTKGDWEGWGTALKPAHEPIVLARKPISEKTIAENCLKWGVGGINIDGCRISTKNTYHYNRKGGNTGAVSWNGLNCEVSADSNPLGRFPANLIHDGSDEVTDLFPNTKRGHISGYNFEKGNQDNPARNVTNIKSGIHFGDSGSAARFFYCAKTSSKERDAGLNNFNDTERIRQGLAGEHKNTFSKNSHPTVKPIALMKYLITLITPKNGVVLDPFMGSGSTGVAAKLLNRKFIGIELSEEYIKIASERIKNAKTEEDTQPEEKTDAI